MQPNYPQGYPQPPQQYQTPAQAYYQQQPPQQPQQPQATFQMPTFVDPQIGGGDPRPSVRHLAGRACAFIPTRIGETDNYAKTAKVPQVTFDVIVIDGGPLEWGDDEAKRLPPTMRVDRTPAEFSGCLSSNTEIVRALSPLVGTGSVMIGRVVQGNQGTQGRPPWLITPLGSELDPQAAQAEQARAGLQAYFMQCPVSPVGKRMPHPAAPTPTEITPGALAARKAGAAAPQQPVQYPPQQQMPAWPANMQQQQPQVQYPPAVQQMPMQQPPTADAPPAGWPQDLWDRMSPDQKAAIRG